ncbi:hypothetical protein [Microbacterium gilvum]|uniref:Uncharacterized protein n=1 Tax=Microbacterium gilvum TaxID=1336204 RepID=A0ABP9AHX8_9MICO
MNTMNTTPVVDIQVADQRPQAWTKLPIPELGVELDALPLIDDLDTGMSVQKVI